MEESRGWNRSGSLRVTGNSSVEAMADLGKRKLAEKNMC